MSIKCYICGILLVSVGIMSGCKKLVQIDPPVNQLVPGSAFASDNVAILTQLSVYAQMQSAPMSFDVMTGLSSDELTNYSTGQSNIDLYKNALTAAVDGSTLPWSSAYNYIYQENAILENVPGSGGITPNTKKLLIGEAKFMRAYWYFYLVNLFGDVPLILSTNYKVNSTMARTPKGQVYQQMISDLKDARNSLSSTYLDATDTVVTPDRTRPTTWAASALLARVYLYNGNYDSAEAASSIVINNTSLFGLPALSSVFLKNSIETIWQIQQQSTSNFTWEGAAFVPTKAPGGTSAISCTLDTLLLNAFDSGDNRRTSWVNKYTSGSNSWYFPYKYKDNGTHTGPVREYSMILRLAEQYLIRAEARAKQNNLAGAASDVNVIRTRAGLGGLAPSLDQAGMLSAIAHERQIELFTEGHRWFDLKRTAVVDAVMNLAAPKKGTVWSSYQQLYPLPTADIQNGINLVQNPGY